MLNRLCSCPHLPALSLDTSLQLHESSCLAGFPGAAVSHRQAGAAAGQAHRRGAAVPRVLQASPQSYARNGSVETCFLGIGLVMLLKTFKGRVLAANVTHSSLQAGRVLERAELQSWAAHGSRHVLRRCSRVRRRSSN